MLKYKALSYHKGKFKCEGKVKVASVFK